jgi:hypothetical protein
MGAQAKVDLSERVLQATQLVSGPTADLVPHAQWVVSELLQRLGPDDLTPEELMSVAVILATAHSRKRSALTHAGHTVGEVVGLDGGLLPGGVQKRLRLVDSATVHPRRSSGSQ